MPKGPGRAEHLTDLANPDLGKEVPPQLLVVAGAPEARVESNLEKKPSARLRP